MTERFPQQRNRSAQRRADADQVSASAPEQLLPADAAFTDDDAARLLDEDFIAGASVREPSAQARALIARRTVQLRQDGRLRSDDEPPRWSVRPSHHLAAVRLLPAAACVAVILAAATLLIIIIA
jgi:hypothetical protein